MVIDTSAVLAILLGEPEAESFAKAIEHGSCHMSAASYLEASIVIEGRGDPVAQREFDLFFRRAQIAIEPVTLEQAQVARQAFRDFGEGRHKAALNFGDCFSYALAKTRDEALLFKGNDFARAGVENALESAGKLTITTRHANRPRAASSVPGPGIRAAGSHICGRLQSSP